MPVYHQLSLCLSSNKKQSQSKKAAQSQAINTTAYYVIIGYACKRYLTVKSTLAEKIKQLDDINSHSVKQMNCWRHKGQTTQPVITSLSYLLANPAEGSATLQNTTVKLNEQQ